MKEPLHTVAALRELLGERFPHADRPAAAALPTGLAALDESTGGLPRRALTELVCAAPSCGGQLLLGQLMRAVREHAGRVALIDGADEFEPAAWPAEMMEHLVWVRCGRGSLEARVQSREPKSEHLAGLGPVARPPALDTRLSALDSAAAAAMAAADLFARDANLELVALDLRRAGRLGLRRIPATTWYRLQRAVEQTDLVLIVLTPFALVPSAQLRLQLDRSHSLAAQEMEREALFAALAPTVCRQRTLLAQGMI